MQLAWLDHLWYKAPSKRLIKAQKKYKNILDITGFDSREQFNNTVTFMNHMG